MVYGTDGAIQPSGLVVLADDARHRAVPIWMQAEPGDSGLSQILELTARPAVVSTSTRVSRSQRNFTRRSFLLCSLLISN